MSKLLRILIIAQCILIVQRAWSVTYYVDRNHLAAGDGNPGTEAAPFRSVQGCANSILLKAGDTCLVYPGNYPEHIETKKGGEVGRRITFKALHRAGDRGVPPHLRTTIQGFYIKHPYIQIEGFDMTRYAVTKTPAHVTVAPEGSNCVIQNNAIRDGIYVTSQAYYFDSLTRTITKPDGGFLAAGLAPGTRIYILTNVNNPGLNHDVELTIKSVNDTTITVLDTQTLKSEGPVFAILLVTASQRTGVEGIRFNLNSTSGGPDRCIIQNNLISNLSGAALQLYGSHHLIQGNIIEQMHGWFIFTFGGSNNIFRSNHVKNSPRYEGMVSPEQILGHMDLVYSLFRSMGNSNIESINNVFDRNFFQDLDNEFVMVESKAAGATAAKPSRRIIFRNNVFTGIELHGSFHRPEIHFIHNTFYRVARKSGFIFSLSNQDKGTVENSRIMNNIFVENGSSPDSDGLKGYYHTGSFFLERLIRTFISDAKAAAAIFTDLKLNGYINPNGLLLKKAKTLSDLTLFQFTVAAPYQQYRQLTYEKLSEFVRQDESTWRSFVADYNFVSGSESEGFPIKRGFGDFDHDGVVDSEFHGVNGGDPKFENSANPLGPDLLPFTADDGLRVRSSNARLIEKGGFITKVESPTGSGLILQIEDSRSFNDGFGIVEGDIVQFEFSPQRFRIVAIDYTSHTITLDRAASWRKGEGFTLAYEGNAPDIGAYEFAITERPAPPSDLKVVEVHR